MACSSSGPYFQRLQAPGSFAVTARAVLTDDASFDIELRPDSDDRTSAIVKYANGDCSSLFFFTNAVLEDTTSKSPSDVDRVDAAGCTVSPSQYDGKGRTTLSLGLPVRVWQSITSKIQALAPAGSTSFDSLTRTNNELSWISVKAAAVEEFTYIDRQGGLRSLPNISTFLQSAASSVKCEVALTISYLPGALREVEVGLEKLHVNDLTDIRSPLFIKQIHDFAIDRTSSDTLLDKLEQVKLIAKPDKAVEIPERVEVVRTIMTSKATQTAPPMATKRKADELTPVRNSATSGTFASASTAARPPQSNRERPYSTIRLRQRRPIKSTADWDKGLSSSSEDLST